MTAPLEVRFWRKVTKGGPDECWLWTGAKVRGGYGSIRSDKGLPMRRAHRVAYELANGPIPPGLYVCHRCDNPPCVNPAHLWLGTHGDNVADKMNKGRGVAGETVGSAMLSNATVIQIAEQIRAGTKNGVIARMFSISPERVSRIASGEHWSSVTGIERRAR